MLRMAREARSVRTMTTITSTCPIKKVDVMRQLVYGEVYAPMEVDSHGDIMFSEDIETMCHRFMRLHLAMTTDVEHDNIARQVYPVECFIARANDPDFAEGSWVLGVKIEDPDVWAKVENGDLNGFSFEALVKPRTVVADVEVMQDNFGRTVKSADHDHLFFVELNDDGRVTRGRTNTVNGHNHEIKRGTATEVAENHSHRYFL